MQAEVSRDAVYFLGHSSAELQRLQLQSLVYGSSTRRLFESAGVRQGMRILDLGSGAGDVSLLLAELVGPTGAVVGVDANGDAIRHARERMQRAGHRNMTFVQSDFREIDLDTRFDAIVGRMVLMYLADPSDSLRRISRLLEPGGIVAFQEFDFVHRGTGYPFSPLYEQAGIWSQEVLKHAGGDVTIGCRLHQIFVDADLPYPELIREAPTGGAPTWLGFDFVASHMRSLLPSLIKYGIATEEEVGVDTFAERLRAEVAQQRGVLVLRALIGAWTKTASEHVVVKPESPYR